MDDGSKLNASPNHEATNGEIESEEVSPLTRKRELLAVDNRDGERQPLVNNVENEEPIDGLSYIASMADEQKDDDLNLSYSSSLNELHFSPSDFGPGNIAPPPFVDNLPIPPDGGYGWVIVVAAFLSNFIVDGICNSFGSFFQAYTDHFQASSAIVSMIGSLLIGVYLLSGPLAGGLLNKFGARSVVIAGSLITAASFLAASIIAEFFRNVYFYMAIYGFLGGIGFGMIYLPAIVVVGHYFERRRALATGISVAGSGVGTFVFPPLFEYCIKRVGLMMTVRILAIFVLACAGAGALYRPLNEDSSKKLVDQDEEIEEKTSLNRDSQMQPENDDDKELKSESSTAINTPRKQKAGSFLRRGRVNRANSSEENNELNGVASAGRSPETFERLRSALSECDGEANGQIEVDGGLGDAGGAPSPSLQPRPPLSPITENRTHTKSRAGSTHYQHGLPQLGGRSRKQTLTSIGSEMTSTSDVRASRPNLGGQLSRISMRSYAQSLSRIGLNHAADSTLNIQVSSVDPKEFARPMSRQDIFYQGSIRNLPEFEREQRNYKSYRESQISIPALLVAQSKIGDVESSSQLYGPRTGKNADWTDVCDVVVDENRCCTCIPLAIRNALTEMIDLQLLKDPVMLLLCASNFLAMFGFYVPFIFIMDAAEQKGVDRAWVPMLLSTIGITNTIGRIIFGIVADRNWLSALTITNAALVACGLLTFAFPFLQNFPMMLAYAVAFGFIISSYICLTSIVLSDLLGLERLTNSFGLLVVSRGIACLFGAPLAGAVKSATNSFDASFWFAGLLILFAGGVSCCIPRVHRWQRSQMKNEEDDAIEASVDHQSGKLSVLTERSEENLTEYQRTIQSLRQQQRLLRDLEEERQKQEDENKVDNVSETEERVEN